MKPEQVHMAINLIPLRTESVNKSEMEIEMNGMQTAARDSALNQSSEWWCYGKMKQFEFCTRRVQFPKSIALSALQNSKEQSTALHKPNGTSTTTKHEAKLKIHMEHTKGRQTRTFPLLLRPSDTL